MYDVQIYIVQKASTIIIIVIINIVIQRAVHSHYRQSRIGQRFVCDNHNV